MVNIGKDNTGYSNSGGWNSGDSNSGYWNSGDSNSGDRNSGYWNSGDSNSGGWNSNNYESGFFNSKDKNSIRIFNKNIKISRSDFFNNRGVVLCGRFNLIEYISKNDDKEIICYATYKQSWRIWLEELEENEIKEVKNIPGFNAKVFEEITGLKL